MRAVAALLVVFLLGTKAVAVEGNMAFEVPGGFAVDVWATPDFSIGLESGYEEAVNGTKRDPLTSTQRRATFTRAFPLGVRAQWRLASGLADAAILQLAAGRLNLKGRLEAGGLSEPMTGTEEATFVRALYAQRWQWEKVFVQAGAGFRVESEATVKVRNLSAEDTLSETPWLGGVVLNLALGARF